MPRCWREAVIGRKEATEAGSPDGVECLPSAAKEDAEKSPSSIGERPPGLKPALISNRLRGAEAPLFHSGARIRDFFRSL
jgi:hypothetical protein